jgi:hypothetical protein
VGPGALRRAAAAESGVFGVVLAILMLCGVFCLCQCLQIVLADFPQILHYWKALLRPALHRDLFCL